MLTGGLRSVAVLVLVVSLIGATPAASSANLLTGITKTVTNVTNTVSNVQAYLLNEVLNDPLGSYRVIVKRHNGDSSADSAVLTLGGTKVENLPDDAFVAVLPGAVVNVLAKLPSVEYIEADALMQTSAVAEQENLANTSALQTMYPKTVGATDLWSQGITGSGVGVAVIDTGIMQVKDFSGSDGQGRIVAQQNFTNTSTTADGYGHGTHIAGIIGGDSWMDARSVQGKYVGVAPDSNLLNLKVADGTGQVYMSDVILAFEWAIAHRVQYNIRVINLSMTSTVPESYHTSLLAAAAEHAWFNGILVVVAAGNYGPNSMYFAPADDPFVVTVGATDANGTVQPGDDWIAPWSSFGTNPDGVTKPDVVAPGRLIDSTLAANSEFQQEYPSRIVDSHYIWMSGTSMSTAVVSGVAALIFQAHPGWTNDQVKWLLEQTATQLNVDAVTQGAGEVNASAAVNYSGTPGYANQGLAINLNLVGPHGALVYDVTTLVGSLTSGLGLTGSAWSGSAWSGSAWSGSAWSGSAWSGGGDLQ